MAHPETPEAVGVPVTDVDSAAAALANMDLPIEQDEELPGQDDSGDDAELDLDDEEQEDEEGEPEVPAIAAPISLNAEEKAKFAQLPPEAQQVILAVETRRNAQVQEATTKASEAQRTADARAAQADAEAKSIYGQQLEQFVSAFKPEPPDYSLAQTDPATYIAHKAAYDAQNAQYEELVQQVRGVKSEADQEAQAVFIQQRDRELLTIPEIANPETRKDYLDRAMGMASELGFDQAELAQGATARDIKALSQIADWKAKAERLDKAMSKQMQKVRAGKPRALRPNAAQPEGSGKHRAFTEATTRLRGSGTVDDAAAAIAALG